MSITASNAASARSLYRSLRRVIVSLPKKPFEVEEDLEECREMFEVHPPSFEEAMTEGRKRLAFLTMKTGGVGGAGRVVYVTDDQGGFEKQEVR